MSGVIDWLAAGLLGLLSLYAGYQMLAGSREPWTLVKKWAATVLILGGLFWFLARMFGLGGGGVAHGGMAAGYGLAFVMAGAMAAAGIVLGLLWAPHIADFLTGFGTDIMDGGKDGADDAPPPLYAIARARRKQGRTAEALAEVRAQLARKPDDFEGLMLQAELQAEDLHDLDGATEAIETLVGSREVTPAHAAFALNRLADWQIAAKSDPAEVRSTIERIIRMYPDTEHMHFAHQRLAHLDGTITRAAERLEPRPLALAHHEENLGLREDFEGLRLPEENPSATAARLVRQLEQHPDDYESRELLALLYAERFQRLDLAVQEIEHLLSGRGQPKKQVVHWLNLLADLYVKHGNDERRARESLERIIRLYPGLAAAENARHRIAYLAFEMNAAKADRVVKLT